MVTSDGAGGRWRYRLRTRRTGLATGRAPGDGQVSDTSQVLPHRGHGPRVPSPGTSSSAAGRHSASRLPRSLARRTMATWRLPAPLNLSRANSASRLSRTCPVTGYVARAHRVRPAGVLRLVPRPSARAADRSAQRSSRRPDRRTARTPADPRTRGPPCATTAPARTSTATRTTSLPPTWHPAPDRVRR